MQCLAKRFRPTRAVAFSLLFIAAALARYGSPAAAAGPATSVFQARWSTAVASGTHTVIYSFGSNLNDGEYPVGRLLALNGSLYGTTQAAAPAGSFGTIFRLDPNGKETLRYENFFPTGGLVVNAGTIYGTTTGSYFQNGSLFAVNPSLSSSRIVYSFPTFETCMYACGPNGNLIDLNGSLRQHECGRQPERGHRF